MARKCKKGYGCGKSCISRGKNCFETATPEAATVTDNYAGLVEQTVVPKPTLSELTEQIRQAKRFTSSAFDYNGKKMQATRGTLVVTTIPGIDNVVTNAVALFSDHAVINDKVLWYEGDVTPELAESAKKNGFKTIIGNYDYPFKADVATDEKIKDFTIHDLTSDKTTKVSSAFKDGYKKLVGDEGSIEARSIALEDSKIKALHKSQDKALGRKPGKQVNPDDLMDEVVAWQASQGFDNSDPILASHDLAHTVAHRLTGLGSQEINDYFGLGDNLFGEEGLVKTLEYLYAGETLTQAFTKGYNLVKAFVNFNNPENQLIAESDETRTKLMNLVKQAYLNNDFSAYTDSALKSIKGSGIVNLNLANRRKYK